MATEEPAGGPVDQGPTTMGEHCTTDAPLGPDAGTPYGEIIKLGDVDCYITKPADYPHVNSKLLLFLTNGVGIHSKNNQLQADYYSKEGGFLVIMPDLFEGDPAPTAGATKTSEITGDESMIEQVKTKAAEGIKILMIDLWLARHTPEKTLPIILSVLAKAKEEFADAASQVFAVGYCFGGKYVLKLAATAELTAGALAHGTAVTVEDIKGITRPVSFVCVENDGLFPDEVREAGINYLEEKQIEHELRIYDNVPHGFAVMGSYDDQKIQSSQQEANIQMLEWLIRHET
ncbi:hypothetical protein H072_8428 [Dactylellina haptotyla CBS 200.50]|uniref:Dienelactone hydrolase domain-containing protein n=1 Tax=Dactylellina haptotyla (strain CBS 200.50) TaxID=1284197 RepID=S8A518_DACHA|nr:hypothetical protein H072_8428 [Dactylellina haptotyla CBS 200.50]